MIAKQYCQTESTLGYAATQEKRGTEEYSGCVMRNEQSMTLTCFWNKLYLKSKT